MAQTTGGISMRSNKIEASVNGSSWTDISGFSNKVEWDGGERATGTAETFDGDTQIITAGKRGSVKVKASIVYTEGASDPVEVARAAYEAGTPYYLRWSPKGGGSTTFQYTTPAGFIKKPVLPGGDANSADPVMVEIELEVAYVTKSVNA